MSAFDEKCKINEQLLFQNKQLLDVTFKLCHGEQTFRENTNGSSRCSPLVISVSKQNKKI